MNIPRLLMGACVLLVALAGCKQSAVQFAMTPAVVSACTQPVAVQISWDVTALGLEQVRAEVNNLGRPAKLWFEGGGKGSEKTGAWARDGFTVVLKTAEGVELGRRTLTTTPCPGIDWL